MYFTDDSLFPDLMQPLIITAAPYGPEWLPGDADVPVSFDEQVQKAVDCYNAGATVLHFHVRDPKTGQGSSNFDQYNELLGRVRKAVPKMIIQVGGSISFAPHTAEAKAKWLDYDTRHMLTELDPKPEFVTVTTRSAPSTASRAEATARVRTCGSVLVAHASNAARLSALRE